MGIFIVGYNYELLSGIPMNIGYREIFLAKNTRYDQFPAHLTLSPYIEH